MTEPFTPFRCECGTLVVWKTGPGRVSEYRRGVSLPVPEDFGIPTCPKCGEQYLTVERGAELAEAQRPAYEAWQRVQCEPLINSIRQRHGITLRQLESVCGVSATYLSQVLHSKREVSTTLLRLLEALDRHPSEVERHLKRPTHARAWVDSATQGTNLWRRPTSAPNQQTTSVAPALAREVRAVVTLDSWVQRKPLQLVVRHEAPPGSTESAA